MSCIDQPGSGEAEIRLHALLTEIDGYLAGLTEACPETGDCRERLAALQLSPGRCRAPDAHPRADCGWLSEALTLARRQGSASLVDAIERAGEHLAWTTFAYPGDAVGRRFPDAHAFVELVGPGMPFDADDFALGLFLIAPRTFYRDHRHAAPELYAPLTGPTLWRFDFGPWLPRGAHQPVWNEPRRIHGTIVEELPFLCIYVWIRDVNEPSVVVAAPDWAEIEQRL
jgi:hypothetical protein